MQACLVLQQTHPSKLSHDLVRNGQCSVYPSEKVVPSPTLVSFLAIRPATKPVMILSACCNQVPNDPLNHTLYMCLVNDLVDCPFSHMELVMTEQAVDAHPDQQKISKNELERCNFPTNDQKTHEVNRNDCHGS